MSGTTASVPSVVSSSHDSDTPLATTDEPDAVAVSGSMSMLDFLTSTDPDATSLGDGDQSASPMRTSSSLPISVQSTKPRAFSMPTRRKNRAKSFRKPIQVKGSPPGISYSFGRQQDHDYDTDSSSPPHLPLPSSTAAPPHSKGVSFLSPRESDLGSKGDIRVKEKSTNSVSPHARKGEDRDKITDDVKASDRNAKKERMNDKSWDRGRDREKKRDREREKERERDKRRDKEPDLAGKSKFVGKLRRSKERVKKAVTVQSRKVFLELLKRDTENTEETLSHTQDGLPSDPFMVMSSYDLVRQVVERGRADDQFLFHFIFAHEHFIESSEVVDQLVELAKLSDAGTLAFIGKLFVRWMKVSPRQFKDTDSVRSSER